ncbi:MAG: 16S rRNA (uracil(1498)-N(3))-methyltransferase, partial [Halioglobus sp.]
MRVPRIFTTQPLQINSEVELEAGPSAHVAKALRMRIGDTITLFNGLGGEFSAQIFSIDKKAVKLNVLDHNTQALESPLQLELGIAISRGDRMDWVIQKATELGATSISPLTTLRTEVKLKGDRAEKKQRHWQQVIISACEQCGRNQLPQLQALTSLES